MARTYHRVLFAEYLDLVAGALKSAGEGYQVIDESGAEAAVTDLDGNAVDVNTREYGSYIFVQVNAPTPAWG